MSAPPVVSDHSANGRATLAELLAVVVFHAIGFWFVSEVVRGVVLNPWAQLSCALTIGAASSVVCLEVCDLAARRRRRWTLARAMSLYPSAALALLLAPLAAGLSADDARNGLSIVAMLLTPIQLLATCFAAVFLLFALAGAQGRNREVDSLHDVLGMWAILSLSFLCVTLLSR